MEGEENKKRNIMKTITKWNESDKKRLIELYQLGYTLPEIWVKMDDRTRVAIASELHLLRRQGRVGYRTSESKAAANERGLFKPDPVEFEDKGVMIRPSEEEAEQAEQAERAERKAITTENQMTDINFSDLFSVNTDLFRIIVKYAAGYYADRKSVV